MMAIDKGRLTKSGEQTDLSDLEKLNMENKAYQGIDCAKY